MECIDAALIGTLQGTYSAMPDPIPPPPDYEQIERDQWRENALRVPDELASNSNRLLLRIRSFIGRFGFPEQDVRRKVQTDQMFAAHFAKEPRRTGIHERHAGEWIRLLPQVCDFVTLPKGGSQAKYITSDGNIHVGHLTNRPGKSLDFEWRTGPITCYAAHKYTKESGGNQDSQHQEMVKLLRSFQSCHDPDCALFVIVDGPYYTGPRMTELRHHVRQTPPRSYAITIAELPAILLSFCAAA